MSDNIIDLADKYYRARGLNTVSWSRRPEGTKLEEETSELRDALLEYNNHEYYPSHSPDLTAKLHRNIQDEIADVAICLAWIAQCHDVDIAEAIKAKTIKDFGRSAKDNITT